MYSGNGGGLCQQLMNGSFVVVVEPLLVPWHIPKVGIVCGTDWVVDRLLSTESLRSIWLQYTLSDALSPLVMLGHELGNFRVETGQWPSKCALSIVVK